MTYTIMVTNNGPSTVPARSSSRTRSRRATRPDSESEADGAISAGVLTGIDERGTSPRSPA